MQDLGYRFAYLFKAPDRIRVPLVRRLLEKGVVGSRSPMPEENALDGERRGKVDVDCRLTKSDSGQRRRRGHQSQRRRRRAEHRWHRPIPGLGQAHSDARLAEAGALNQTPRGDHLRP